MFSQRIQRRMAGAQAAGAVVAGVASRMAEGAGASLAALHRSRAARRALPGLLAARLIDQLLTEGSFQGALDGIAGFAPRGGPEGQTWLRHPGHLAGAQLTPQRAALILALPDHAAFAHETLSTLLAARLGRAPVWQAQPEGALETRLPLGAGLALGLAVVPGPVDPLFINSALPGLTLHLRVIAC